MRFQSSSSLFASVALSCAVSMAAAPSLAERAETVKTASQIGRYRSFAIGSSNINARGGGPSEGSQHRDTYVHERFSRDLVDGCEYRADVRGTIQPSAASNVEANLVVRADLHCPNVSSVRAPVQRLTVRNVSADRLAQRVAAGAKVMASRDGRACAYEPDFVFRDGTLVNTDVSVRCNRR